MSRNDMFVDAPPDAVFDVLADARSYAYWVIGADRIRAVDDSWPAPGSSFHHVVGVGPVKIRDHTRVEEIERPRLLQLKAKARPFGTARVRLELEPERGGTRVTMVEDPADSLTAFVFSPLTHLLVRGRNRWSLARLKELAEGKAPMPSGPPPVSGPGD